VDDKFQSSRLKSRAVALFHGFSPADQKVALALLESIAQTDGTIAPEERALHDESCARTSMPTRRWSATAADAAS